MDEEKLKSYIFLGYDLVELVGYNETLDVSLLNELNSLINMISVLLSYMIGYCKENGMEECIYLE